MVVADVAAVSAVAVVAAVAAVAVVAVAVVVIFGASCFGALMKFCIIIHDAHQLLKRAPLLELHLTSEFSCNFFEEIISEASRLRGFEAWTREHQR